MRAALVFCVLLVPAVASLAAQAGVKNVREGVFTSDQALCGKSG